MRIIVIKLSRSYLMSKLSWFIRLFVFYAALVSCTFQPVSGKKCWVYFALKFVILLHRGVCVCVCVYGVPCITVTLCVIHLLKRPRLCGPGSVYFPGMYKVCLAGGVRSCKFIYLSKTLIQLCLATPLCTSPCWSVLISHKMLWFLRVKLHRHPSGSHRDDKAETSVS